MVIYKLAQKVEVGVGHMEWVDIHTETILPNMRNYIKQIKQIRPDAVLSLRSIEEKELPLEE